jgi:hypothetical protein
MRSGWNGNGLSEMVVAWRRGRVVYLVVAIGLLASSGLAASGTPVLRSASQARGHVVVRFTVVDLQPWLLEAAVSGATDASGEFLPREVRLREHITARPDPVTGVVRWRTLKRLPPRVYYVEVSGIESDGVTDCLPQLRNCLVHWSNVRRVQVR